MDLLVNIDVEDLDRAVQFYTSAFDLTVGRRFGADGAELLGGSAPIYLLVKAAGSQASSESSQTRDYGRHWTPVHLDIVVEDVDVAVQRATCNVQRALGAGRWREARTCSPIQQLGKVGAHVRSVRTRVLPFTVRR